MSISGEQSETKPIKHGVPQGSVLGPLLFIVYINDIYLSIKNSNTFLFADDTQLLHINKSLKSLTKKVNMDLKLLHCWLCANKISLNSNKTEFILFRHKRKPLNFDVKLKLNGDRLYPMKSIKFLGVLIDENLNWCKHSETVATKLRRANGALSKLRHYVPSSIILSIYYAIFHSHMSYASQVWVKENRSRIESFHFRKLP